MAFHRRRVRLWHFSGLTRTSCRESRSDSALLSTQLLGSDIQRISSKSISMWLDVAWGDELTELPDQLRRAILWEKRLRVARSTTRSVGMRPGRARASAQPILRPHTLPSAKRSDAFAPALVRGNPRETQELTTPSLIHCLALTSYKFLEGATMPNGQKYEDWRKSRGENGN